MSQKYSDARYPEKINDLIDNEGGLSEEGKSTINESVKEAMEGGDIPLPPAGTKLYKCVVYREDAVDKYPQMRFVSTKKDWEKNGTTGLASEINQAYQFNNTAWHFVYHANTASRSIVLSFGHLSPTATMTVLVWGETSLSTVPDWFTQIKKFYIEVTEL